MLHIQHTCSHSIVISESAADASADVGICITNKYDFLTTAHVAFEWRLSVNGVPIQVTTLSSSAGIVAKQDSVMLANNAEQEAWNTLPSLIINPRTSAGVLLPLSQPQLQELVEAASAQPAVRYPLAMEVVGVQAEAFVEVRACMRPGAHVAGVLSTAWAPEGFVICHQQLKLERPRSHGIKYAAGAAGASTAQGRETGSSASGPVEVIQVRRSATMQILRCVIINALIA